MSGSPLFRRGELKAALLDALGKVEPANGYVIMQAVADRLDGAWQPSPGAVYPALLGLEDAGLIMATTRDGAKEYELSGRGRRALLDVVGTLDAVAERAHSGPPRGRKLGRIIDDWASGVDGRDRRMDEHQEETVRRVLQQAADLIEGVHDG